MVSVTNVHHGGINELVASYWANGALIWTDCYESICYQNSAIIVDNTGNYMFTMWYNDQGNSGNSTLIRYDPNGSNPLDEEPRPGLTGKWLDPDHPGTFHVITWQNRSYVVLESRNINRSDNELTTQQSSPYGVGWTYCVPNGACIYTGANDVIGDFLYTNWADDQGSYGYTVMVRAGSNADIADAPAPISNLIGKWLGTDGTLHNISWANGKYIVESAHPNRGGNEVNYTHFATYSLSWTYCIPDDTCITIHTGYRDGDDLLISWKNERGESGDTILKRVD